MAKYGVIITNIGTPQSSEVKEVRAYLKEFLMDPFVIDIPWVFRTVLVNGIIAPFRAKSSSEKYKSIWTSEGSPLLIETLKYQKKLQKALGTDFKVVVGMRYGEPSLKSAIQALKGCETLLLFPQYPQYAESSTRSSIEAFKLQLTNLNDSRPRFWLPSFYEAPEFIDSLVQNFRQQWGEQPVEHLLLSYHGLPAKHLKKIDPEGGHCGHWKTCCEKSENVVGTCYRAQCFRTSRALAQRLGLSADQYTVGFQSRLGRQEWIPPYSDHLYRELAQKGVKKLLVMCPSFVADCLETLEEVAMEGKETFLEAGGESFQYISCVNSEDHWIAASAQWLRTYQNQFMAQ